MAQAKNERHQDQIDKLIRLYPDLCLLFHSYSYELLHVFHSFHVNVAHNLRISSFSDLPIEISYLRLEEFTQIHSVDDVTFVQLPFSMFMLGFVIQIFRTYRQIRIEIYQERAGKILIENQLYSSSSAVLVQKG